MCVPCWSAVDFSTSTQFSNNKKSQLFVNNINSVSFHNDCDHKYKYKYIVCIKNTCLLDVLNKKNLNACFQKFFKKSSFNYIKYMYITNVCQYFTNRITGFHTIAEVYLCLCFHYKNTYLLSIIKRNMANRYMRLF